MSLYTTVCTFAVHPCAHTQYTKSLCTWKQHTCYMHSPLRQLLHSTPRMPPQRNPLREEGKMSVKCVHMQMTMHSSTSIHFYSAHIHRCARFMFMIDIDGHYLLMLLSISIAGCMYTRVPKDAQSTSTHFCRIYKYTLTCTVAST